MGKSNNIKTIKKNIIIDLIDEKEYSILGYYFDSRGIRKYRRFKFIVREYGIRFCSQEILQKETYEEEIEKPLNLNYSEFEKLVYKNMEGITPN